MSTYHSPTELTINVRVRGVKHHLVFTPTTLGESFLTVDDPLLQRAIEHHPYFGKLFERMPEKEPPRPQSPADNVKKGDRIRHLVFTDFDDAKEQLAQMTGLSRTAMRTPEDLLNAAKNHGIAIDGMPP